MNVLEGFSRLEDADIQLQVFEESLEKSRSCSTTTRDGDFDQRHFSRISTFTRRICNQEFQSLACEINMRECNPTWSSRSEMRPN